MLFQNIIQGQYLILYSRLLDSELLKAPQKVKELSLSIPENNIEIIGESLTAENLADLYIKENVVGETSRADCLHIALATLHRADILISWNFKHIVNVNRIRGYNSVNQKQGYNILEIRTPREILEL